MQPRGLAIRHLRTKTAGITQATLPRAEGLAARCGTPEARSGAACRPNGSRKRPPAIYRVSLGPTMGDGKAYDAPAEPITAPPSPGV